jgi:DNA-binding NarL/FixJ family response regulator
MRTKLLIVDDHRVFSEGLEALFAAEPDFDPMVATDPEQTYAVVAARKPDAVLMDVRLGTVSGIELTRRLTQLPSPPAVIVLTAYADIATAAEAIRAGAVGFVAKSASVEQVMSAVRAAALGGTWLPAGVLGKLVADFRAPADEGRQLIAQLTAREQQVLSLMVSGMDRNRIALQLHQSPNTVRTYIQNMTAKLGCHSAIEAVAVGLRAGLRPK